MTGEKFAGDKKAPMHSPLAKLEKRFVKANVDRFPRWVRTWQLTMLTIPWTAGIILFGWLAATRNLHYLWGSSAMLFLQWFTDLFDGAIGRTRNEGLVKWGFYADHLLDFLFMPSVFIGYAFLATNPLSLSLVLVCGFLYAAMMVHSFLLFAATNEFRITFFGTGPTEIRLYFILFNTIIIFLGFAKIEPLLPYFTILMAIAFIALAISACRELWSIDMENKNAGENEN